MKKIISISIVFVLVVGIYFYIKNNKPVTQTQNILNSYTSNSLNISFKYPSDWVVTETNDYPGSAQGNDEIKISKGSEMIYTSVKRDCLENYTMCKPSTDVRDYPYGWPFFSTQSNNQYTKDILDSIIKTVVTLK